MNKFTGQKDVDIKILNLLDDKDLIATCQTNQYVNNICSDDIFWRDRLVNKYGKDSLSGAKTFSTYREFYTSGKVKTYLLCREIEKFPRHSQLVVDDFYDPYRGLINYNFTKNLDMLVYLLLKIVLTRVSSFPDTKRNEEYEEELKRLIKIRYDLVVILSLRNNLDPNSEVLTESERNIFLKIIDVVASRDQILRNAAKLRPEFVKALSPRPEDKFLLISYIHMGFQLGEIPLDILWMNYVLFHIF